MEKFLVICWTSEEKVQNCAVETASLQDWGIFSSEAVGVSPHFWFPTWSVMFPKTLVSSCCSCTKWNLFHFFNFRIKFFCTKPPHLLRAQHSVCMCSLLPSDMYQPKRAVFQLALRDKTFYYFFSVFSTTRPLCSIKDLFYHPKKHIMWGTAAHNASTAS